MKIELYDEISLVDFMQLSGARIMQIFHDNYPVLKSFNDYQNSDILKKIDDIFNNILKTELKSNHSYKIGYQMIRENLFECGENYEFVIPESSNDEIEAYDKFTTEYIADKINKEK